MYERYANPARYAVFYAVWYTRLAEATNVDSVHLLKALMYKEDFRSNSLFHLREHFPLYCSCPSKFGTSEEVPEIKPVLTNDVKRILAYTAREADWMRDYWIDTEHLLLGILAERGCLAERYLTQAGITSSEARRTIIENKHSRPEYGKVSQWWELTSPMDRLLTKWREWKSRRRDSMKG